jgi:hypothetical protein
MSDRQENPYLTATYAPRPTAPFNGIGVLADTQASINHAQNAIATYGYNLDTERDRAQARVIKDTAYPYAVKQTDYMGRAGVLGAQAENLRAGNQALYQGLPIDQFDPITGQMGVSKDANGNPLYGGIQAPTVANPTLSPDQAKAFSDRAFNSPYQMPPDLGAEGQLNPLTDLNAGVATTPAGSAPGFITDPYNMQGLNIPGTPSSMVGITRGPQLRPGVTPTERDSALRSVEALDKDVKFYQKELAEAKATLGSNPNWFVEAAANNRRDVAIRNLERLTPKLNAAAGFLQGMVQTPGPVGPPLVGGAENNYGIPRIPQAQGAPGADPLPTVPANATSYQAPPTMPPQLVPAFNNAVSLYTQHAPGGPGGTEAALLFSGLESTFAPSAKASGSRAAGLTQFTPDTWLRVAKQLPWAKGKSDDEIAALRTSPAHQAQAERQLRMLNYAAATAKFPGQFDPANPLNLYAMHHFGEDTGGKIAAALRKSPNTPLPAIIGPKAWASALAANPYLARKGIPLTPAQLYSNWINRAKTLGFYGGARA